MSYQVGSQCFATPADAAGAACAQFVPSTSLSQDGTVIRNLTCSSPQADGSLVLNVASTLLSDGSQSTLSRVVVPAYPSCVQQDYVDASLLVFAALLSAVCVPYSLWLVYRFVNFGARNQE